MRVMGCGSERERVLGESVLRLKRVRWLVLGLGVCRFRFHLLNHKTL